MRPASAERMDQLSRASIGHIRPVLRTIAQHSLLWRAMPQHDMLWFAYRVLRTIAPLVACYNHDSLWLALQAWVCSCFIHSVVT